MGGEYRRRADGRARPVQTEPVYRAPMSERYRDDERAPEIFEVRATRIDGGSGGGGPGRRWRPPWSIVLIGLLAVVVPAVAFVGPRIEWRPEVDLSFLRPTPGPSPTPTPRPTPRPTAPIPTELPELTWGEGERPTDLLPLDLGGLRFVEPSTGALTPPAPMRITDGDAIFSDDKTGGWWCVCLDRTGTSTAERAHLTLREVDAEGQLTRDTRLVDLQSGTATGFGDYSMRVELERSPDDRIVWLGVGTREENTWTIRLISIDRTRSAVLADLVLTTIEVDPPVDQNQPVPDDAIESYLNGPKVRLSPDGRTLLAVVGVDRYAYNGNRQPEGEAWAWLVEVDPASGGFGPPGPIVDTGLTIDARMCWWGAWLSNDEYLAGCVAEDNLDTSFVRFDRQGVELGRSVVPNPDSSYYDEPILDRANRRIVWWSPVEHRLTRIDLESGQVMDLELDPERPAIDPEPPPASLRRPDWTPLSSDYRPWSSGVLAFAQGSDRLYLLGMTESGSQYGGYGSTGIWLVDAATGTIADFWPADVAYQGLGLSRDGRWLLGIGAPGVNAQGEQTKWSTSLWVYDIRDGRVALRLGHLGEDYQAQLIRP